MSDFIESINKITESHPTKLVLSKPTGKENQYKKVVIEDKGSFYQIAKYTDKQVFHENGDLLVIRDYLSDCLIRDFLQLNAWSEHAEHQLLLSKKGTCTYKKKAVVSASPKTIAAHNRRKNYLLEEGSPIPPLVDMGIFTQEGKVVRSMYDKFKQINRFIELSDDEVSKSGKETWHIIDFGCGKSYLTFIMYYYFTEIRHVSVEMIGLDLKEDVIEKCNAAARKYHYTNLRFEMGDINGYKAPFDVDMVVTLHACDTATDYALYNAIQWNADLIFSVPCCQHELNKQMHTDELALFTRYGIVQERFAALTTDAIRANLLSAMGYRTQLLEFVDLSHTPKNILIRAVKTSSRSKKQREQYLAEIDRVTELFHVTPTLQKLLNQCQPL